MQAGAPPKDKWVGNPWTSSKNITNTISIGAQWDWFKHQPGCEQGHHRLDSSRNSRKIPGGNHSPHDLGLKPVEIQWPGGSSSPFHFWNSTVSIPQMNGWSVNMVWNKLIWMDWYYVILILIYFLVPSIKYCYLSYLYHIILCCVICTLYCILLLSIIL